MKQKNKITLAVFVAAALACLLLAVFPHDHTGPIKFSWSVGKGTNDVYRVETVKAKVTAWRGGGFRSVVRQAKGLSGIPREAELTIAVTVSNAAARGDTCAINLEWFDEGDFKVLETSGGTGEHGIVPPRFSETFQWSVWVPKNDVRRLTRAEMVIYGQEDIYKIIGRPEDWK